MAKMIIPGGYVAENAVINSVTAERDALNFRVGCTDRWVDAQGAQQEYTEWTDCVIYGPKGTLNKTAEKLIVKGQLIYAEGKKRTNIQRDESGKYKGENTQCIIDRGSLKPLGPRPNANGQQQAPAQGQQQAPAQQQQQAPAQGQQQAPAQQQAQQNAPAPVDDFDDDIPF